MAENNDFLHSLHFNDDDVEEILEALQRLHVEDDEHEEDHEEDEEEETFDNRSSWHMRTLMAQCVEVVDRLKLAVDTENGDEVAEVLALMASMGENSKELQLGLMRASAHIEVIEAGQQLGLTSEHVAEGKLTTKEDANMHTVHYLFILSSFCPFSSSF